MGGGCAAKGCARNEVDQRPAKSKHPSATNDVYACSGSHAARCNTNGGCPAAHTLVLGHISGAA